MAISSNPQALTATDAEALSALHATSFPAPWPAGDFATLLASPGVMGWRNGDAFILVRAVADEAEILTLAVNPAQRRQGLASQLITQAFIWLAVMKVTRIFLEVAADNAAALGLYKHAGFSVCGQRKGYYGKGTIDAVVMRRDLST